MTSIPLLSYGTYKIKGADAYDAVLLALSSGYRSIDTARCYHNEEDIGRALRFSALPRSELFITSKIAPWEMTDFDSAYAAILASLRALNLDYLDLMLIHWPGRAKTPLGSPLNARARQDCWRALQRAKAEGMVRQIGVSNFTIAHLRELISVSAGDTAHDIAVNQVERHPLFQQHELLQFCRNQGIVLQSYSPLGCADHRVMHSDLLSEFAAEAGMTVAELCLAWQAQQDVHVVVKSVSAARIQSNYAIVVHPTSSQRLDKDLIKRLEQINADEQQIKCCWDPIGVA